MFETNKRQTKYLGYLAIKIDENLYRKIHIHDLASNLNRANALLAKLRHFVNNEVLGSTYFTIFHSHLHYVYMHSLGTWGFSQQQKRLFCKKSTANYEFCAF